MLSPPRTSWICALLLAILGACAAPEPPPETVTAEMPPPPGVQLVVEGPVLTVDYSMPRGSGVVVDGGLVQMVSQGRSPLETVPGVRTLLRVPDGGVVMPGIIESHAHLLGVGRGRRILDLKGTGSAEDVAARVAARAASLEPGTWILGRGWNQEAWTDKSFPDRATLDAVVPDHPVLLTRVDGHAAWVNSLALDLGQVGMATPAPAGGEIIKDAAGRPSGVLIDNAIALVRRALPPESGAGELTQDYLAAQDAALALGITTFVDAGASETELLLLSGLYEQGLMKLRVYAMLGVSDEADLQKAMSLPPVHGLHDDRLTVRAVKLYADGALGSRGAWLLEPYSDRPGHHGLETVDPGFIERVARRCLERGYQVCVHAIGDRANREALDAFERALAAAPAAQTRDHRFRLEHAQLVDSADLVRFRDLGVIPAMQTCHATSDGPWVPARIGRERTLESAYVWRKLLESGCFIPNGTDAPVESLSPWENLFSAVYRGAPGGFPVFNPLERMNRLEALKSLTLWGARGSFAEDRRGALRPGYAADLVILDRDPMRCSVWELAHVKVLATVIAGEVVWMDPDYAAAQGASQ